MNNSIKKLCLIVAFIIGSGVYAFAQNGMKITTGHPDLKIKITRCEAIDNICIVDMIFENVGTKDVAVMFFRWDCIAYDDEGNAFDVKPVSLGKNEKDPVYKDYVNGILPSQIPLKARIQIDGVPESSTMFRRIELGFECLPWDIRTNNKSIKFYNVPISREGD